MSEFLSDLQASISARMAADEPADDILRELCQAFEGLLVGSVVGVTILDPDGLVFEHAVFPSLADDYAAALKGILVADKPGSCALAVFEGRTVECTDVVFDGRFSEGWRELGLKHGLRALVSIPAVDAAGATHGTLVVTHPPGEPLTADERALADAAADLAAQVLRYRVTRTDFAAA